MPFNALLHSVSDTTLHLADCLNCKVQVVRLVNFAGLVMQCHALQRRIRGCDVTVKSMLRLEYRLESLAFAWVDCPQSQHQAHECITCMAEGSSQVFALVCNFFILSELG